MKNFKTFIDKVLAEESSADMGKRLSDDMENEWPAWTNISTSGSQAMEYKSNLLKYFVKSYGKGNKKDIETILNSEIPKSGDTVLTGPKNLRGNTNMRILRSLVKANIIKLG